jgi:hypothetical protein
MDMSEARPRISGHRFGHFLMLLGTAILHISCFKGVNFLTRAALLPIHDYHIFIDDWIPYLGWTGIFYYLGNIYVLFGAGSIVWGLPDKKFHRAIYVYTAMILTGAFLELIFVSVSPWPAKIIALQETFHKALPQDLYAALPSMHVVLTVFPTGLAFSVVRSRWLRSGLVILAALITISTLTFKEHVFLDAITGILLALVFCAVWRFGCRKENFTKGQVRVS